MRTTVNIHDGLLETVKQRAREQGKTLGDLIEDALQGYLLVIDEPKAAARRLPVFQGGGGVRPGIDLTSNASIYEALGDEYEEFAKQVNDGDGPAS